MVATGDNEIDRLLSELKGLNLGQNSAFSPAKSPVENTSPGGYQAPIKGGWHSSGGFDASGALRPNGRRGHSGVDMRAPAGTAIYPLAAGVVTSVGTDPIGGNVVNVQHSGGVRSYYAHLSTAKVQKSDKVSNETILGTVGNTGNASTTFPHLHFQVWKDNQLQDPAHFFSVPKYTNLSSEEKQKGPWLSEKAKQEASAFNMQSHVQQKRVASSADTLMKVAHQFCKLVNDQAK